jgi:hypothetical protein
MLYDGDYKLRSSSLCNFFQPPTASPLLAPHILLSVFPLSYYSNKTMGWRTKEAWFSSQQRSISVISTASRPALGSALPPIRWIPGALSLGKLAGAWSWPFPSVSAEELCLHTPCLHDAILSSSHLYTNFNTHKNLSNDNNQHDVWYFCGMSYHTVR